MDYLTYDFETRYSSKDGLTLRKLSVPEYVGHPDFDVHCLGVEFRGKKKVLWGDTAIRKWIDGWREFKGEVAWVAHNAYFDLAILKWRYGFTPSHNLCTLLMANHVLGSAKDSGKGNSLADLAERLGLEVRKGDLSFMDGVHHPDEQQRQLMEVYLNGDLTITRQVLDKLLPHVSNPDVELWLIDHTLKIYATKPLDLNYDTVARAEKLIAERRAAAINRMAKQEEYKDIPRADLTSMLSSNKMFENQLLNMLTKYGEKLPTKTRALTKPELKKLDKLKAGVFDARGTTDDHLLHKVTTEYNAYLTKLQSQGCEIWQEPNGTITVGATKKVPALAKKDEDFIRLSYSSFEGVSALVDARLIERSATTNAARLTKMRRVAGGLGVMPIHLVYYGAHTGRWSGGGGFNFQNMANPDREKDPGKKEIAACVRESFEAPDGYVFISADEAQVEARVSAWIAGQWDLLDEFKQGVDVYSSFISGVLSEDIHKPAGTESPEIQAHLKLMRHIGKEARLGLGYSMGWRKFVLRLREDPDVARMFISGRLTDEFCQMVVTKYRELNPAIVDAWKDLNNAFFTAKSGGVQEVGPVRFRRGIAVGSNLPVVNAILPSGRSIYYRDIRQVERTSGPDNGWSDDKEWKHGAGQRVYGGLILENITQGIARDLIVESILRAELDRKLPIIMNIHDSIIALSPEDEAEDNLKWMIESLRTNPEWASDRLVLNAEGKIGKTLST